LDGVQVSRLLSEDGGDPQSDLALADKLIGIGDKEPQVSFELVGTAPVSELSAAEIEVTEWRYDMPSEWTSTPLGQT
jgi:hypothetical protein